MWVARRPPGYAFVEFDDRRDALDAIRALDGEYIVSYSNTCTVALNGVYFNILLC